MKIPVKIVVEVDVEEYRADYDSLDTLSEIREDIRARTLDAVDWELRHFRETWYKGVTGV